VGPILAIGGVPGGWGSPGGGLNFFQQAPVRCALGLDPEDLLDAIDDRTTQTCLHPNTPAAANQHPLVSPKSSALPLGKFLGM